MKNNVTIAVLGITTVATVFGALTAPSAIHQIAVFAGGSFSVLVALAVCVAANIGSKPLVVENSKELEAYAARKELRRTEHMVRSGRLAGLSDADIATALNLDIDVVSTIK